MAKNFKNLKAVIAINGDGKEVDKIYNINTSYRITSIGDTIFKVNHLNMTIERYSVKRISIYDIFFVCKSELYRNYIPTYYCRGRWKLVVDQPPFEVIELVLTRNSCGLFFINMKDAAKCIKRLQENKYFGALKCGDVIYMADRRNLKVSEITIEKVEETDSRLHIHFQGLGFLVCSISSKYDYNVSKSLDSHFYTYRLVDEFHNDRAISLHIDKKDAEKAIRQYTRSKEKTKKKNEGSFQIGKLIKQKDVKGNDLRIGDTVIYARRCGSFSFELSIGTVIGDSGRTKIAILDDKDKQDEETNGIHRVIPSSVLLK